MEHSDQIAAVLTAGERIRETKLHDVLESAEGSTVQWELQRQRERPDGRSRPQRYGPTADTVRYQGKREARGVHGKYLNQKRLMKDLLDTYEADFYKKQEGDTLHVAAAWRDGASDPYPTPPLAGASQQGEAGAETSLSEAEPDELAITRPYDRVMLITLKDDALTPGEGMEVADSHPLR